MTYPTFPLVKPHELRIVVAGEQLGNYTDTRFVIYCPCGWTDTVAYEYLITERFAAHKDSAQQDG